MLALSFTCILYILTSVVHAVVNRNTVVSGMDGLTAIKCVGV